MRVQKSKTVFFFLFLNFFVLILIHYSYSSGLVQWTSITDTATFEATKRFGDQSTVHFLRTFYDIKGRPAVYLFLVAKNREAIPENLYLSIEGGRNLIEEGQTLVQKGLAQEGQNLITNGRAIILQEHGYGTLYVSAKREGPSLISFHHGLPTYITAKKEAEDKANDFSNGENVTSLEVLYVSPFEYYFEFEIGDRKILVDSFSHRLILRTDLEKNFMSSDIPFFGEQDENAHGVTQQNIYDSEELDDTGTEPLSPSSDTQSIPGVPDYHQPAEFSNSCGPTAGACLLGYWDSQGSEDLLKGIGDYDDVVGLIGELCVTMSWNPSIGVPYSQIPIGLQRVIDDRGYEIGISSLYGIDSLDIVKQEIIEGRPFIYGSQKNPWGTPHYVVAIGYQENFIIVHDNWQSTPVDYFVNWDALRHIDDMITTLIPEGQVGPPNEPLPSDRGGGSGGCFIETAGHR